MQIKPIIALAALAITFSNSIFSQVGIGTTTPDPSAELDVTSTSKGFLLPRMTTTQRNAIGSPASGLVIYNTTTSKAEVNVGSPVTPNWQATSLPTGTSGQTLRHDGTNWVANSTIFNNGTNVGIGTTSPLSNLDIQGSLGYKINTITAATTLNQTHNVVLCNTGPYTVTLPAASSNTGKVYYIKNISSTNVIITLNGNASETIDGSTLYLLDLYKHAIRIICDGSNWHVLEESGTPLNSSSFTYSNCDGSNMAIVDVLNPVTGKIWMDRNLGASRVATSATDVSSYGEFYQWGRLKDGHQCLNSSTTATLSSTDVPINANFITINSGDLDWRSPQNNSLWQGVNGTNNPCPNGYRIPTEVELNAEMASWSSQNASGAFSSTLKLPMAGARDRSLGVLIDLGVAGNYWSSTTTTASTSSRYLYFNSSSSYMNGSGRAVGRSIRCLKN